MKKHPYLFLMLFITALVFAQSPEKISYQAIIRNSSNQIVTNQSIGMQISILQDSASGTVVYSETQNPTSNDNGLITFQIGNGTIVSGTFNTIDWANATFYAKTEIDPTGGTSYTITGTSQLMSVPYALYAKTSGSSTPGPAGIAGTDGKTILNGSTDPNTEGNDGDFYFNTTSSTMFGPKTSGTWGSGTSFIGPEGPLTSGTINQTLRHDGTNWVASSTITNDGYSATVRENLRILGYSNNRASLALTGTSSNWQLGTDIHNNGGNDFFLEQGGCCTRLFMSDNGELAIGANFSTPTALLDVDGTFHSAGNAKIDGDVTGVAFKKTGGTGTEFLKADGSVDTNEYALKTYVDDQISNISNTPAEYAYGNLSSSSNAGTQNISSILASGISISANRIHLNANKVYLINATMFVYNMNEANTYGYRLFNVTTNTPISAEMYWGNPNGSTKIANYTTQPILLVIKPTVATDIELNCFTGTAPYPNGLQGSISVTEIK